MAFHTDTSASPPPVGPGGATATMDVGEVTTNLDAGADPNWTAVAPEKSDPKMVTVPPPATGP